MWIKWSVKRENKVVERKKVVEGPVFKCRVGDVRVERGMSRYRIGTDLGITPQTMKTIEAGGSCRPITMFRIARYLKMPIEELWTPLEESS